VPYIEYLFVARKKEMPGRKLQVKKKRWKFPIRVAPYWGAEE